MLARSEDEFNMFQKMDNERIMKNAGKPKLMEESELPEFLWLVMSWRSMTLKMNLSKTEQEVQEREKNKEEERLFGSGARKRNEVDA